MVGMSKDHVNQPYILLKMYVFRRIEFLYPMSQCPDYDNINTSSEHTYQTV
jgi:hypothetical protein